MMAPSHSKKKRSKGKGKEKSQNQHILPQISSTLLQLPRELRDQIYTCLFASIRLTFGKRATSRITTKTMKPATNALAILRACRQINQEAGPLWLGQILFSFENPEDLLDKLSALASTTLSQIRHVRTGGCPLMLQPIEDDDDVYYRLVWVLKLLPGLRLDKLTVLGYSGGEIAYDTLEGLIKHGTGWRELHFITPNSTMLGFGKRDMFMADPYWRKPQPSTWNEILLQRDGTNSGASATIYRSTQSDTPGAVTSPRTRQIFEQNVSSLEDLENFGVTEDKELSAENEKGKELLVVVKRGRSANIVERDGPPYESEEDIRQWAHGMTWTEIRRQCIDFIMDEDEENDFHIEGDEEYEIDSYNQVDEYEWTHVN
jgi:hypothetical protein